MVLSIGQVKEIVEPIAKMYGLSAVYLFGSYARGEATVNSDFDFYIKRGNLRGMFQLAGLMNDLEEALNSSVDIVLEPVGNDKLDAYLVNGIEKDGVLLYAA